ncbi:MAG: acyl-CoA dehydrogenase family protein [Actinophytocola sp.]|uniref:acyl-CoA dehydrogenase family protein n=1 Tax=Actinophytocola sp. TaxID=1872138 RepID=UPI003C74E2AD
MRESFYQESHDDFRDLARSFVSREVEPNLEKWDEDRLIGREVWRAAAACGLLGLRTPEEYGGAGVPDYRYRCVLTEELSRVGAAAFASSLAINEDIVSGYLINLGSADQQRRWLPGMAEGEVVASIAMSEPGVGSDLRGMSATATRTADGWVLNGAKTFITNGGSSDVVLVAARTGEHEGRPRFSLLLVPTDSPGFSRGRTLRKLGLHAQDTAELFFDDVVVPLDSLVGEQGRGFHHLTHQLPLERLSIAWRGLAGAEAALSWTLDYVRARTAFGQRIIDFQHTRFRLAELVTEVDVTRAYLENLVSRLNAGHLDATTAAKAKWWATELQQRVVTACLQMHGGYGYMDEYPIARAFADARVQTIVGGTTEIMKEIIGRELAAGRST